MAVLLTISCQNAPWSLQRRDLTQNSAETFLLLSWHNEVRSSLCSSLVPSHSIHGYTYGPLQGYFYTTYKYVYGKFSSNALSAPSIYLEWRRTCRTPNVLSPFSVNHLTLLNETFKEWHVQHGTPFLYGHSCCCLGIKQLSRSHEWYYIPVIIHNLHIFAVVNSDQFVFQFTVKGSNIVRSHILRNSRRQRDPQLRHKKTVIAKFNEPSKQLMHGFLLQCTVTIFLLTAACYQYFTKYIIA